MPVPRLSPHKLPVPVSPAQQSRRRRASLSQAERNVREVILGDLRVDAWYPSFYPEELTGRTIDRLFVCKWCFKYTTKLIPFHEHVQNCCSLKDSGPTGTLIYEKDNISIYEVDGQEHKLFAQNLSLFAKLFLDTKSVFYDVTTFMYYTLCISDPSTPSIPARVVGFFSKEKLSWDSNNLACICVFPPWQKQGLGQILMAVSYELSKWDGRLGGPEKPLSELGRKAYVHFWSATIARYMMAREKNEEITVKLMSEVTYIMSEDIIATMKEMDLLEHQRKRDGDVIIVNKAALLKWMTQNWVDLDGPVDPEAFLYQPPTEEIDEEGEEEEEEEDEEAVD